MPGIELDLKPVDFLTVGTVGPRGKRVFYIQGAKDGRLVSLVMEKFQVSALAEAIDELLAELDAQRPDAPTPASDELDLAEFNLELRDPIQPEFRVAQIGLGYDEALDMVVLVTQEMMDVEDETVGLEPGVVRFWAGRRLMRALSVYCGIIVERGRPDPQKNGRIHYYWT
ncbi:MAG: DUF3090 family protein [Anaerolineae bacterium]|nr:DUF3090 family protein [Anaerolineae bacterium]